ncbi:hypothetical protein, partial [Flavobacterium sp. A45]|uniref:hypothetical protein n=1 Tax=Flavobacterium sp. A45 TaxID=1945862 RepID=UPI0009C904ED
MEENTLENQLFVKQAIESVRMGAEVDLAYRVIVDQSLKNNSNLYGVYTQLGKAPTFDSYLKKFDSQFSVANLNLSVDNQFKTKQNPDYWDAQAITLTPENYLIKIIINNDAGLPSNIMKFPKIISALVFIHEMMHAELYRKLLTCSKLPNVNTEDMTDDQWRNYLKNMQNKFKDLYKIYTKYALNTKEPSPYQHQYMALKY